MSDVILILRGAIDNLSYHCLALLRVIVIPLVILLILEFEVLPVATGNLWIRTITLFYIIIYALLMLSVFRIFIVGPQAVPQWGVYTVSKSTTYFILYIICLFIILYAISYFLFSSLPRPVGWVLFFIVKVYLLARIVLVFPAISVNVYFSFTSSWRRTKKYQPVMLVVASVVVLLREFSKFLSNQFFSKIMFLDLIVEMVVWFFILALLSETFKMIQIKYEGRRHHSNNSIIG